MDWCRLWNEMINDPKFRAVSIKSGQHITLVISVYVAMLNNASANKEARGTLNNWNHEDVGASLDSAPEAIEEVYEAMQGKLLLGDALKGWAKRQKDKEDATAAERKRRQREKGREATENVTRDVTLCHGESRHVTKSHALDRDREREEERKEKENAGAFSKKNAPAQNLEFSSLPEDWTLPEDWRSDMRTKFALAGVPCPDNLIDATALQFRDWQIKEGRRSRHWRQEWGVWVGRESGRVKAQPKTKKTATDVEQEIHAEIERVYADMVKGGTASGDDGPDGLPCGAQRVFAIS